MADTIHGFKCDSSAGRWSNGRGANIRHNSDSDSESCGWFELRADGYGLLGYFPSVFAAAQAAKEYGFGA